MLIGQIRANLTVPAGRATIEFHSMLVTYKSFKEWVYAAAKLTPDVIQTNKSLANKPVGSISAIYFTSPNSQRGWIYESYFVEINGTPINLELNYQRTSQNASEYRAVLDKLVESLERFPTVSDDLEEVSGLDPVARSNTSGVTTYLAQ